MIDYVDASKFLQDSLDKQIHINSVDGTISITNADIVGESFTLTESICSEENLIFGSCEPSCIKFTVKNTIPKMYKKWFNVTIELQGSSTPFVVGEYRVWSEKPSSDRTTKEITAYDDLYGIFRNTYKRWYKNLWTNTDTMTIKQFRDAWFTRLQQTHSHISQETTTLVNDDVIIKKSKKITKPSGKDIFNAICEINGVFGKIGRDGVFHYITLNDNSTTYPIANAQTIEVDYEDYTTTAIDRLEILDPEGDILGYAGESADDAENTYTIENNFMLKGLGNDDSAKSTGDFLAQNIFGILQYVTFIPIDANFKGNPCFETGDRISFAAHGNTITSYILERTMKGIQSLRDNYMSEGDIEYPESVNTYSAKIKELKNDVGSKSTNNVNTANVSSLSDVNNGDTYFKINQSRTIFKKYTASNVAVADLVQNSNGISFNVTTNTSGEHETIIFKLEGLTVGETVQIEWYYRITQWNNSYYNSYVWGVGFSEIYPIHDASGYNVYPLGYPVSSGQGVAKTKTYNGKTCYWYTFEYSTSWKSVTWISPKATAKTMYLYFSSDDVTDGQTFKWEISNLKFTQPVTLVDSEPKKEVDELYVNSDGDWYRFSQSDASHNSVGSAQPTEAKTGDLNVLTAPPIRIESFRDSNCSYWNATQLSLNSNGKYNITVTGYSSDADTPMGAINAAIFKAIGFGGAGTYHIKCKMQFQGYTPNAWGCNNMGIYISYDSNGIYYSSTSAYGTLSTTPEDTFLLNLHNDQNEHEYSFDFTIDNAHGSYIQNNTMYLAIVMDRCWKYYNSEPVGNASGTLTIKDLEITGQNVVSGVDILGLQVNVDGTWKNVDYVNDVSQTQSSTGGTEIAEIQNTNGTKTKIYQKTVDPNPTGTPTETLSSIGIGDTLYELGGASAVSDLTDVDLTSLSNGQILKYNSTNQKWENANESGGGGSAEMLAPTPFIYSEDEEQVGIWKDGKPLYQKVVNYGALPNASGSVNKAHNIANVDNIFIAGGYFVETSGSDKYYYPLVLASGSNEYNIYTRVDKTNIRVSVNRDRSSMAAIVVVQYTKTTDAAWQGGFKAYGFSPVIYSDAEREIGVWEDGKPLYQKTVFVGALPNNSTKTVAHNISDYDFIVSIKGSAQATSDPDYNEVLPFVNVDYRWNVQLDVIGANIKITTITDASAYDKAYVTLQYTKTTDTAGSGKYTTLGTPTVHYDGEERVIGTWFGKPLYRKVFTISNTIANVQTNTWTAIPDIDDSNMKSVIKCTLIYWDSGSDGNITVNYDLLASTNRTYFNNKLAVMHTRNSMVTYVAGNKIIVEYTKLSD